MAKKEIIMGIDEAGRGALAGPVVAAAFVFNDKAEFETNAEIIGRLKDSKQLTEKKREEINDALFRTSNVFSIQEQSAQYIDARNILNATKAAATEAFIVASDDYRTHVFPNKDGRPHFAEQGDPRYIPEYALDYSKMPKVSIMVDGDVPLVKPSILVNAVQKCIVKGDTIVPEIMAASILAKVRRDEIMRDISTTLKERFGGKDPYNLAGNKGYGTPEHLEALRLYGPTEFHRKTFKRVKEYV